ncbi:Holo-[acyl-carrier protein] synthase [plant metagenome]|uniref:Holo-[acyl-carrier protein] synthase n=1 Tax=plant metagenome TaxID=1297885 RepID=A0A484UM05_9ZZZZ
MYPRIGVDLVSVSRVKDMIATAFGSTVARMLRPDEIQACRRAGQLDAVSVAGRLAIKEAVFKTFQSRGHPLPWRDIQVQGRHGEAPCVALFGRARRLASAACIGEDITVSLTHEHDYAVAVAFCLAGPSVFPTPP